MSVEENVKLSREVVANLKRLVMPEIDRMVTTSGSTVEILARTHAVGQFAVETLALAIGYLRTLERTGVDPEAVRLIVASLRKRMEAALELHAGITREIAP